MKKEQKLSVTAIIFYVFAVLFLAYTAMTVFTAYEYVASYVEQGTISYGSDFKEILSLYVQQAGPYLVYSLLLYGVGYVIDGVAKVKAAMEQDAVPAERAEKEDDKAFIASLKAEAAKTSTKETKPAPKKESPKKEKTKKEKADSEPKKESKPKTTKTTKTKKKTEKPAEEGKAEAPVQENATAELSEKTETNSK